MEIKFTVQQAKAENGFSSFYSEDESKQKTDHTMQASDKLKAYMHSFNIDLCKGIDLEINTALAMATGEKRIQIVDQWDLLSCLFVGDSGNYYISDSEASNNESEQTENAINKAMELKGDQLTQDELISVVLASIE